MTTNQLIAVAAVVAPCATAILVGYWHRKQMRQIELYRRDPSVGVRPPPIPPVTFFKRYWDLILGVGVPVLGVAFLMARNDPATTFSAGIISLNFACIVYNLYLRSERRLLKLIDRLLDIDRITTATIRAMIDPARFSSELARVIGQKQMPVKEVAQKAGEAHPNTPQEPTTPPLSDSQHER